MAREGVEQLVMTGSGLVSAGQDGINDSELRFGVDMLRGQSFAGMNFTASSRSMFKCSHYGCPDGNNVPTPDSGAENRGRSRC
jgi:hypothetical protein